MLFDLFYDYFISNAARILSSNNINEVSVKTSLHSPGDIILQVLNFTQENIIPIIACYMVVFGGKIGNLEFNSLLKAAKYLSERKYNKQKKEFELQKIKLENELLKQEIVSKKLENLEKSYNINEFLIDSCAEPLYNSSLKLDIQEPMNKIIDLNDYLN